MIRDLNADDINICVELMIKVYNNKYWNCQWNVETAARYLTEYFEAPTFVGFALEEEGRVIGAMFCHKKTWWTNDEIFIDEFFVSPSYQNKGYGKLLLSHIENYSKNNGYAGITLSTNKYAPAKNFYEKQGYCLAEHVIYFYKEV